MSQRNPRAVSWSFAGSKSGLKALAFPLLQGGFSNSAGPPRRSAHARHFITIQHFEPSRLKAHGAVALISCHAGVATNSTKPGASTRPHRCGPVSGRPDVVVSAEVYPAIQGGSVNWFDQPVDPKRSTWPRRTLVTQCTINAMDLGDMDETGASTLLPASTGRAKRSPSGRTGIVASPGSNTL